MTIFNECRREMRRRAYMENITGNKSGYRRNWYGNTVTINVNDRKEAGRVADSIAEWKRNCCTTGY